MWHARTIYLAQLSKNERDGHEGTDNISGILHSRQPERKDLAFRLVAARYLFVSVKIRCQEYINSTIYFKVVC